MYVQCKVNDGFEDQLSTKHPYRVIELGENSYKLLNDRGVQRWYGQSHFQIMPI